MGDCYSVTMKLKHKDANYVLKVFKDYIDNTKDRINWSIEDYAKDGLTTDSVDGMAGILLAGWEGQRVNIEEEDGAKVYSNGFNASYGWNSVLQSVFISLCEKDVVDEGSYIDIWSDGGGTFSISKDDSSPLKYRYGNV